MPIIEIEQGGLHAPLFSSYGQMDADGRFTGTAFLADNGDCFHTCVLIICIVCDHTCKHQNDQAKSGGQGRGRRVFFNRQPKPLGNRH